MTTRDPLKPKILTVRLSSLGDVVLTTALFPNLKAKWPECEVTVLTKTAYAAVFDSNPSVDHVRLFDPARQPFTQLAKEIKEEQFDVIIDLHGNPRSFFLRMLAGAPVTVVVSKATWARYKLMLFKLSSETLRTSVRERILGSLKPLDAPVVHTETQLFPQGAGEVLRALGIDSGRKLIGIAPGAKHNTKKWGAKRFAEAANRLGAFPNSMVVILGDKSDSAAAEDVSRHITVPCRNLAGWTSLKELIAVISRLSFLLTNDSGILHMAEALNIPLVALFGPTVRAYGFAPYKPTSRVAEVAHLSCRPCTLHGDVTCPLKHHKCMEDIDVNAVLYAASDLLEGPAGKSL